MSNLKINKRVTSYTDNSTNQIDTPNNQVEQESIFEIQQYFDQPLVSDSCCDNQAHLFMLEGMSCQN